MSTDDWVTVAAYDTPFLAQMVTDRLDEAGIRHRTLFDDAGGNLPHIAFATGGHRVQVAPADEALARRLIEPLPDPVMDDLDVGEFDGAGTGGVQPMTAMSRNASALRTERRWIPVGAAVLVVLVLLLVWLGMGGSIPGLTTGPFI